MTPLKKFLIGSGIFCALFLVLVSVGIYFFIQRLREPFADKSIPPEIQEARVLTGAGGLAKSEFFQQKAGPLGINLSRIEHIKVGQLDGQPGLEVGIITPFGAQIFDTHGKSKELITFRFPQSTIKVGPLNLPHENRGFYNWRFIDVEGDGITEVYAYGGGAGFVLFNNKGEPIVTRDEDFTFNADKLPRKVVAGDLDGNGTQEFIKSWYENKNDLLEAFDAQGNTLWKQRPERLSNDLAILDVDNNGQTEIVSVESDKVQIFDAQGNELRQAKLPGYFGPVDFIQSKGPKPVPQILDIDEGVLWLVDFSGNVAFKADAPLSSIKLKEPQQEGGLTSNPEFSFKKETEEVYQKYGAWVQLQAGKPPALAVVATFVLLDRSLFYVYDEQGKLLYQEILPEDVNGLAIIPLDEKGQRNAVLVAGENTVWQYSALPDSTASQR